MTPSKRIAAFGKRGQLVRVVDTTIRGEPKYVVWYGAKRNRGQRSFDRSAAGKREALAFAESFAQEMQRPTVVVDAGPITTRGLWLAYQATWVHLRPRSKQVYTEQWNKWEAWYGRDRDPNEFRLTDAYAFRAALEKQGLATATVQAIITCVRMVYRIGEKHELINKNRWHLYTFKVAKELRTKPRAEYTFEEWVKIWREMNPTLNGQWRGYCITGLLGLYGMRQRALLHLRWEHIEPHQFTLQAEYDKTGEAQTHLINPEAAAIFAVAKAWADKRPEPSPWVFPAGRVDSSQEVYTLQSYWDFLMQCEARAGVTHIKWRAGHAFRRMVVGDLVDRGADLEMALRAIGDKDPRMAKRYLVRRNARLDSLIAARAASIGGGEESPNPENEQTEGTNKEQTAAETETAPPLSQGTAPQLTTDNTRT